MANTSPYLHPIQIDIINNFELFENGKLKKRGFGRDFEIVALDSICSIDTARQIVHYNSKIVWKNYHLDNQPLPPDESRHAVFLLTATNCFKLNTNYGFLFGFGDSGGSNEKLLQAISLDVDIDGNVYIADAGDNSIKVYDLNGNYAHTLNDIGIPVFLKLRDQHIFVVDSVNNSINRYDTMGNYVDAAVNTSNLYGLVSIGFDIDNTFWIIDQFGKRLNLAFLNGGIAEEKTDYCLDGSTFYLGQISSVDAHVGLMQVCDYDKNLVINFTSFSN